MNKRIVLFLSIQLVFLLNTPLSSAAPSKKSATVPPEYADTDSSNDGEGDDDLSSYRIGPQNMLQVKIFSEAGINNLYRVDESGNIKHALAGRVKVGGLTVGEAEKKMEKALADGYIINPQVNVFVLEYSHFSIIGEVRKPGDYEITGRMSVIRAISLAGGFTPIADQHNVQIIRRNPGGSEQKIKADAGRIMQGDKTSDIELQADDVVVVGKSFF